MPSQTSDLAVMFADISGSTRLYERLGDDRARQLVADTLALLSEITGRYEGTVIKEIGDEIMCTFGSASQAAAAACDMQESLEELNEAEDRSPRVSIRIGMHHGPAILENDDVFGDAVNIAARMAAQAKARQIMTTSATADSLPAELRESTRFVDYAPIKGKGEIEIVEILWQQDDVTRMSTDIQSASANNPAMTRLRLQYGGDEILLDNDRSVVVLGRSPVCDLQVNESLASRQHVRIELRRDKFFIIDQSTNGTYVSAEGGESFLRREELPLPASGAISLGRSFSESPNHIVEFSQEA